MTLFLSVVIPAYNEASNTHEWFSHRAERGQTGRFGAVIVLD